MLAFIVDTQLPPLLASVLKEKGHDAIHTTFFPDGHLLNDQQIRSLAITDHRIIITKDKDFFDYYLIKGVPPKLLLLEVGNVKNRILLDMVRNNLHTIELLFETSSVVVMQLSRVYSYQ